MELFFKVTVWICLTLIVFYVFLYHKNHEKLIEWNMFFRKTWYIIYFLGAIIYWNSNTTSIFEKPENYAIVLGVFIAVDALIFLNLYVKKAGIFELDSMVNLNQKNITLIKKNLSLARKVLDFLCEKEININNTDYISELKQLLKQFAYNEDLEVELLPFETDKEKRSSLENYSDKAVIIKKLKKQGIEYGDNYALQLIEPIMGKSYLLRVIGKSKVTEMHLISFGILIITYELLIQGFEKCRENNFNRPLLPYGDHILPDDGVFKNNLSSNIPFNLPSPIGPVRSRVNITEIQNSPSTKKLLNANERIVSKYKTKEINLENKTDRY